MSEPRFKIGDTAFLATYGSRETWIVCPECMGKRRLRVIMGDDSEVSIDCVCCARGWEGSPGKIQTYEYSADVQPIVIGGVETQMVCGEVVTEYKHAMTSNGACYHVAREGDVYPTQELAQARADILAVEHAAEERKRIGYKERDTRTWAWNAAYHRKAIREAERQIEYHSAKLGIAREKTCAERGREGQ